MHSRHLWWHGGRLMPLTQKASPLQCFHRQEALLHLNSLTLSMCINGYWDITAGGTLGLDLHPFQGVGEIFL